MPRAIVLASLRVSRKAKRRSVEASNLRTSSEHGAEPSRGNGVRVLVQKRVFGLDAG